MWMETVECNGPYNFDAVLDRLSKDPIIALNKSDRSIKVPLLIEDKPYVISVKAIGTIHEPAFEISGKDVSIKEPAQKQIERIFRWNFPLKEVDMHFQQTNIAKIFEQHKGTPIVLEFEIGRAHV